MLPGILDTRIPFKFMSGPSSWRSTGDTSGFTPFIVTYPAVGYGPHEDTPHLGSASLALQGAVLASAVLKNSAIVVKIPYARMDPWPETPDLRVIYFDMF